MIRALLLLIATLPVFADVATKLVVDQTTARTGERVTGTMTIINRADAPANTATVDMFLDQREQYIAFTAPPDWTCEDLGAWLVVRCSTPTLAANAEVAFPFSILLRNDLPWFSLRILARSVAAAPDPTPDDNEVVATVPIVAHPTVANLAVHVTADRNPVPPGTPVVLHADVRNNGPAAAQNVLVRLFGANGTIAASGWTCVGADCRRASLANGESASITLTVPTSVERIVDVSVEAGAESSFDPSDNEVDFRAGVGDPDSWRRILLPFALTETPGANGSLWRTDITGWIADGLTEVLPDYCFYRGCPETPVARPFDLLATKIALPHARIPSSFVVMRKGDDGRLALNLRVRDLTRTAETWGTEMPAVRESELRTTPIVLMPLPVDPLFRTTLRVYDLDARPDATITIQVYADDEATPRATLVRALTSVPDTITTALLPMFPGYLQLDPIGEAGDAMAGAKTAWIRIEPRTPGLRFWAFASVTNNPTGHVTTVTP